MGLRPLKDFLNPQPNRQPWVPPTIHTHHHCHHWNKCYCGYCYGCGNYIYRPQQYWWYNGKGWYSTFSKRCSH